MLMYWYNKFQRWLKVYFSNIFFKFNLFNILQERYSFWVDIGSILQIDNQAIRSQNQQHFVITKPLFVQGYFLFPSPFFIHWLYVGVKSNMQPKWNLFTIFAEVVNPPVGTDWRRNHCSLLLYYNCVVCGRWQGLVGVAVAPSMLIYVK